MALVFINVTDLKSDQKKGWILNRSLNQLVNYILLI
jgi:hypothetical protein